MWTARDPPGCLKIITWCLLRYPDVIQPNTTECYISHPHFVTTIYLKCCTSQALCCLWPYLNFTLTTKIFTPWDFYILKHTFDRVALQFLIIHSVLCGITRSFHEVTTTLGVNLNLSGAQRKGLLMSCCSHPPTVIPSCKGEIKVQ